MIGKRLSHYTITELLGEGGMGVVYRARDENLGRDVAVKVLHADVTADAHRRQRFEREARAVAALSHPNIVTIFDFGVERDIPYAVMELLDGETLASLLRRGPLPEERAIPYGVAIARGLAAAHQKRILHRDLKPANVIITRDDQVKILDFGLAKPLYVDADPSRDSTLVLTSDGTLAGTPSYMSPEQLQGMALDGRSDLFSLGVVLAEMLTGSSPFHRGSSAETMSSVLRDEPKFPDTLAPGLRSLLVDCLCKDPARRIASATDFAHRLEANFNQAEEATSVIDSIAVLPFHNAADDEDSEYLIDGLTDSLIDNLSQLPKLKVMARSTVYRCREMYDRPDSVGKELGVRAVLTGRLQRRRESLMVRAELVDATDGTLLWGNRFNRDVTDMLTIEDEICREITDNLRFRLSREEKDLLAKRRTQDPLAQQAYWQGRFVWNRWKNAEAMRTAIGHFEKALEIDPTYASAYAGLADSYAILGNVKALPPHEAYPKAKECAEQGLALDDRLAELHSSMAFIQNHWDWDWKASETSFRRAIELNPGYATAHRFYGSLLSGLERHDEAIPLVQRARELDPLSIILHTSVGDALFYARRYDEAMKYYRKSIAMDADFIPGHTDLARALELSGRFDEAIEEFRIAERLLTPEGPPEPSSGLAHVYAQMGRTDDALAIVEQLKELSHKRYVSPYGLGSIYACLGEVETALDWLERAHEQRDQTLVLVKVHPRLDSVRSHPRYHELLRRMDLDG